MNPVTNLTLRDMLKLIIVWLKSKLTSEGRKEVRKAMLYNKIHAVATDIDIALLKPHLNQPKKAIAWPSILDDLFLQGIRAIEMSDGRRWEWRCTWEWRNALNEKCSEKDATEQVITSYKWVSATYKKTNDPKVTVTPKTQRVMNPHTGEYEDVAL